MKGINVKGMNRVIGSSSVQTWFLFITVFPFSVIAFLNFLFEIQNSFLSIAYRMAVLSVSAIMLVWGILSVCQNLKVSGYTFLRRNNFIIILLFLTFWILYFIRMGIDLYVYGLQDLTGKPSSYYVQFAAGVTFIPMIAGCFYRDINVGQLSQILKNYLRMLSAALVAAFLYIMLFGHAKFFRYVLTKNEFEYLDAISIAITGSLLAIVSQFDLKKSSWNYLWAGIGFFLIAASASRGPLLSILVVMVFIFLNTSYSFRQIVYFILTMITAFLVFYGFTHLFSERFLHGFAMFHRFRNFEDDMSSINRLALLTEGFNQILQNPFTGTHIFVLKLRLYVHNLLFDILLSTGLIGLACITPAFIRYFKLIIQKRHDLLITAISLFFFCQTLTSGSIYNLNEFWFLFAALTFGLKSQEFNQKSRPAT